MSEQVGRQPQMIMIPERGISMPTDVLIKELQKALGEAHSGKAFAEAQVTACISAYEALQTERMQEQQSFVNTVGNLQTDIAGLKGQLLANDIEPMEGVSGVQPVGAEISQATADAMAADEIAMDDVAVAQLDEDLAAREAATSANNGERGNVSPIRVVPAADRVPRPPAARRRSPNAKKHK